MYICMRVCVCIYAKTHNTYMFDIKARTQVFV